MSTSSRSGPGALSPFLRWGLGGMAGMAFLFAVGSLRSETELTVSAAASLTKVMRAIGSAFEKAAPGTKLRINLGSSGALRTQIENGAPVDVYVSASPRHMDSLEAAGLVLPGSRREVAGNQLVLIVPAGEGEGQRLPDSAPPDFRALTAAAVRRVAAGDPRSVPAGEYAAEVFAWYGIAEALSPKLIHATDVRQVLQYVATGNVDAGVVYASDAKGEPRVRVVAVAPPESHALIRYPSAVVAASRHPEQSALFVAFLESREARRIFEDHGFADPPQAAAER